jgi:hypothetical protein
MVLGLELIMIDKPWVYISVHPDYKAKIDREDLARVSEFKWRVTKGASGRIRVVTSVRKEEGVRSMTLGKFLMNPPKGKQVYPRRFNEGLDYRKSNLVICTVQERQQMLPKNRKASSSIYRGVSFSKNDGKWRAGIEVEGRSMNLGNFTSEIEAGLAYNEAARKHFGKDAYQNPIRKKQKRQD